MQNSSRNRRFAYLLTPLILLFTFVSFLSIQRVFADVQYVYDSLNRLIEVRYPDRVVRYTYDDGGNRTGINIEVLTFAPAITSLSPRGAVAGIGGLIISVTGSNFSGSSVVKWNGLDRATTLMNPNTLSVNLLPGDLLTVGTASVVVANPSPSLSVSNAVPFSVVETAALSGRATSGGVALSNVLLTLTGTESASVTTDANGSFNFAVLNNGSYTLTPSRANYAFTPTSRQLSYAGVSQSNLDFEGALVQYTISGRVANSSNAGIAGVAVSMTGSQTGQTTTDANGNYSIQATAEGTYTITPVRANYTFTPSNATFTNLSANQTLDLTANLNNYTISGRVARANGTGVGGVSVALSGSQTGSSSTDPNGNYQFTVPAEGSYTVTPSRVNNTFLPPTASFSNLSANQTANFTAVLNTYTINGRIAKANGDALPGVSVALSGSQTGQATTDSNGNYTLNAQAEGTYTITPQLSGYTFNPPNRSFANLGANQTGDFTALPIQTTVRAPFDFDGDNKSDLSIFRPSLGQWWLGRSTAGLIVHTFGNSADIITPGDFTGDGSTDVAIFRPSNGEWFVLRSENFSFYSFPFGANGDVPVTGDYDGDGRTDAAVFRPSNATWYIQRSSGGTTIQTFGASADRPVPADYDGDGKTDIAIYRPSLGQWWLNRSTAGVIVHTFGNSADRNVPGDYTGDGKADIAIFRPSNGEWFILRSEDASFYSFPFGTSTDLPVPGDYDGDGKFDAGVFRPSNSTWYLNRSTAGVLIQSFGLSTDVPVPSVFVR